MFEEESIKGKHADSDPFGQGAHITGRDPFSSSHKTGFGGSKVEERIIELEVENLRLQRLVAELLMKNQQLRKQEG
jgi:hypothetical protein